MKFPIIALTHLLSLSIFPTVTAANNNNNNNNNNNDKDNDNSCCSGSVSTCCALNVSATLSLIFVILIGILLICYCFFRLCYHSISRSYHRRFGKNAQTQRQVTSWLHNEDLLLDSVEIPNHRATRQLTQFKGFYSVGKNVHHHPFTMAMKFNFDRQPRTIEGFGIDSNKFVIEDGIFTVNNNNNINNNDNVNQEYKCQITERFDTGEIFIMYGICENSESLRFTGSWLSDCGSQQGTFEFEPDEDQQFNTIDNHNHINNMNNNYHLRNHQVNNNTIDDTLNDDETVSNDTNIDNPVEIELTVLS